MLVSLSQILGTCLGMQAMTSCNNEENLIVKIEEEKINRCQPMVDEVHKVVLKENSKLANILNTKELIVNSVHSFHVEGTGPYGVAGYSEDGIIEAIEYKENDFNIGLQWHPEKFIIQTLQPNDYGKCF